MLTNIKDVQTIDPDLTITINRTDLEQVMAGQMTFDDQIEAGKAKRVGDRQPYEQLKGILVQFTPDFESLPGTKAEPSKSDMTPFEQEPPALTDGGVIASCEGIFRVPIYSLDSLTAGEWQIKKLV